jgi:hypothetical protein
VLFSIHVLKLLLCTAGSLCCNSLMTLTASLPSPHKWHLSVPPHEWASKLHLVINISAGLPSRTSQVCLLVNGITAWPSLSMTSESNSSRIGPPARLLPQTASEPEQACSRTAFRKPPKSLQCDHSETTTSQRSSSAFLVEKKHQAFFRKKHRTRKNSSVS